MKFRRYYLVESSLMQRNRRKYWENIAEGGKGFPCVTSRGAQDFPTEQTLCSATLASRRPCTPRLRPKRGSTRTGGSSAPFLREFWRVGLTYPLFLFLLGFRPLYFEGTEFFFYFFFCLFFSFSR